MNKRPSKHGTQGVRPIGIGETFRRIFGKSVMTVFKSHIQAAGGCLQTCTGIRSGIEQAIHAATDAWQMSSTEAIVQVDADNAFDRLNRKVSQHNIQQVCPQPIGFCTTINRKLLSCSSQMHHIRRVSSLMKVQLRGTLLQWHFMQQVLSH